MKFLPGGDRRIYGFSFSGDLLFVTKGKLCHETLVRSGELLLIFQLSDPCCFWCVCLLHVSLYKWLSCRYP